MNKEVKNMKKRTFSISLCMLMIGAAFVSVAGADDWSMYGHDSMNTRSSSSLAPEVTSIIWTNKT